MSQKEISIIDEYNTTYKDIVVYFQQLVNDKNFKIKGLSKFNKVEINETFRRYINLVKNAPTFSLTVFGPMIFSCRKAIEQNDAQHFLDKSYHFTMKDLSNEHNFDFNYSMSLIELSKEAYINASQEQKDWINGSVKNLLILYGQYAHEQSKHTK